MTASMGDFHAMRDVLVDLANQADELGPDEAIAAMEALGSLASEVKRCSSMIETALKRHLESGSRDLGGRTYALKAAGKQRFDHPVIDRLVAAHAVRPDENGELPDTQHAVARAIRVMAALYRSASTQPKVAPLKALGVDDLRTVSHWERTGTTVEVVDQHGED